MVIVKFTNLDEFIEELTKDKEMVERNIVRVTCRWRRLDLFTSMSVVATAVVAGELFFLEADCGSYLGEHDAWQVRERTNALADKMRQAAESLGLEHRAGIFAKD